MSDLYNLYKKVGNENFGAAVGKIAPYFSTIAPEFVALRPGYCEIKVKNEKSLHNHLNSIHAIAMCNGAELVAGLMTDVSIPDSSRWIPIEMNVKYLNMAKGDLRISTNGEDIDWNIIGEQMVNVDVYSDDTKVMEARITMKISAKPTS